jgi:hypothetical protein
MSAAAAAAAMNGASESSPRLPAVTEKPGSAAAGRGASPAVSVARPRATGGRTAIHVPSSPSRRPAAGAHQLGLAWSEPAMRIVTR